MNITDIEKLVEKYYNGNTTLDEERTLHEFLSGDSAPASLEYMKKQFAFYENEHYVRLDNPKLIDKALEPIKDKGNIRKFILQKSFIYAAYGAAAMIVIAIAINLFSFLSVDNSAGISQSTISDPKEAYHEARQALILVSTYVDEALTECKDISKFDEYRKIIFSN